MLLWMAALSTSVAAASSLAQLQAQDSKVQEQRCDGARLTKCGTPEASSYPTALQSC